MAELEFSNVTVQAGDRALLADISVKLSTGELVALVGPNGAGKTSLLQAGLELLPTADGCVTLNGLHLSEFTPVSRAKQIAYLPQVRPLAWALRVKDTVALGRFAYGASAGRLSEEDATIVTRALVDCEITDLGERPTDQLSGGELARVHCARAFAAKTPLLLADEPVNALDLRHQLKIMALIRAYVNDGGGALVVMHDIGLAARFADRLIWIKEGKIVADGPVTETLTSKRMEQVFSVSVQIASDGSNPNVIIKALSE